MTLTTTVISNKEVSSFSSNNSLAKLTQEEREEVIQQFVRQGSDSIRNLQIA